MRCVTANTPATQVPPTQGCLPVEGAVDFLTRLPRCQSSYNQQTTNPNSIAPHRAYSSLLPCTHAPGSTGSLPAMKSLQLMPSALTYCPLRYTKYMGTSMAYSTYL